MAEQLRQVLSYHEATKHHLHRHARGPGYLDWETQPDPFRRYRGAPLLRLPRMTPTLEPSQDHARTPGKIEPAPLDVRSVAQLLYDSLALSAWKRAGSSEWALRVNPSSGNLHPTEGYLVCGPVRGLCSGPMVCHYAPGEHALELRAEFPLTVWQQLCQQLPQSTILVGLTSIHWREAWKYGERAYRYCQLDVGHALGAISVAASGLEWQATLIDDLSSRELALLLGVFDHQAAEPEQPDCLLALYPCSEKNAGCSLERAAIKAFPELSWQGKPNKLSADHVSWPIIEEVATVCTKPPGAVPRRSPMGPDGVSDLDQGPLLSRHIIHQRRSALAMDATTYLPRASFYHMLMKTMPGCIALPFATLPWPPMIHLAVFVHRVHQVEPGLYLLVRDQTQKHLLQAAMRNDFEWTTPDGCPEALGLYRLTQRDMRELSMVISCHQDIAGDGCFSLGMIACFLNPLETNGAWFYPRLYWECGMIGQVLYLEAEAAGLRGTGIGCFFDDAMHDLLGLGDLHFQDLYHFTIGGAVEDQRLTTMPPYPEGP